MQQFIGRKDWLLRFQRYLQQEQGVIWRITGQPGIGKSTLLRRFEYLCEQGKHPNVWLDMEGFTPAYGLEVLTELARSARFFDAEKSGKSWREKAGEGFKTVSGGALGLLELGKAFIPGGEMIAGGAKVVVDLCEGVAGNAAQMSENAAAAQPELYLLEALAKAGEKRPVCLVDTCEHLLRSHVAVQSRLLFGFGQPREGNAKAQSLVGWLGQLFDYLQSKGWCIVMAGREIRNGKTDDQLPRFLRAEILEAARNRPALAAYLPDQEIAIGSVLATLSFEGNPLWLQVAMNLLENLLAEGKDLSQLAQQPDYLHECFETDDPFDMGAHEGIEYGRCKLTLLSTLTSHIAGLEDNAWKIALPRVLDKDIVAQLFEADQARAILHNFKIAGVFRLDGQQFTLHEEIRDLLLAYARNKGWLDTGDTRALYGKLWDYLNGLYLGKLPPELRAKVGREGLRGLDIKQKAALEKRLSAHIPLNWMLEACYCQTMGNCFDDGVTSRSFWVGLSGSLSLSLLEKWQVAERLPDLYSSQVSALVQRWAEETDTFRVLLPIHEHVDLDSYDTWRERAAGQGGGDIHAMFSNVSFWQERVGISPTPNNYYRLALSFNITEQPTEEIAVYDEMAKRFGEAPEAALRELVAKALVNKGFRLGQLNRSEEAIAVCDEVVKRYGDAPEAALREQVAKALVNKGFRLGQLNRSAEAAAAYDEVVKRYGDAPEAALREGVAKALVNKGFRLGQLNRSEEAIAAYDEVVKRYGESPEAALREQVAKALVNKGFRLGQLNRSAEAAAAYDEVVKRYGDAPEAALREQVAMALNSMGFTLLCEAKKTWKDGGEAIAAGLLNQALEKVEAALQRNSDEPIYLGNQGYTLFLLGRVEEARPVLAKCIALGGEALRQAELSDADIHPLPQDEAFKALIESL